MAAAMLVPETIPAMTDPGVVFAVPWIEVEFGQRPEGYKIFLDKEECVKVTKMDSHSGPYEGGGGYFGPARPLRYFEIPIGCLEDETHVCLMSGQYRSIFSSNDWEPRFKSKAISIK